MLEERRYNTILRVASYQQKAACYYNAKVKGQSLNVGDLVFWKVTLNTRKIEAGTLGLIWEGPYKVINIVRPRTYGLVDANGRALKHLWNAEHLKYYYQ